MGIFNKIMDVLYEEDGSKSGGPTGTPAAPASPGRPQRPSDLLKQARGEQSAPPPAAPTPAKPAPAGTTPTPASPATPGQPTVNEDVYREFCDSIGRALEAANLPGFDFFEFHQLYKRFIKEGKSEDEAIQTALTSAETMRVSRNVLLANYKHYEKVLSQQEDLFQKELDAFYAENIKGAHEKQSRIDESIAAKEQEIEKLKGEIEALKEQKVSMGLNADKAVTQTEEVKASFARAFAEISDELRALVGKIQP